jgi:succinoglycan biosynthesis protein ExoW
MTNLAVIIPFYQKKAGILRQTLSTVLAQRLPPDVTLNVVVVDDGSPSPARLDIEGLTFSSPFTLTLVEQANGGCGAARDTGLKQIDDGVDYIAFLDSDDSWMRDHIANAVTQLDKGYDFYFTDHSRTGYHDSHFKNIGFPEEAVQPEALRQIEGDIWEIDRDHFFKFFLRKFTSQISTIVYRRAVNPAATFQLSLREAAEDYLFMLQIVKSSRKICFANRASITCGDGINVYYSTFSWDDEGHIRRYMADILGAYVVRSELSLTGEDGQIIEDRVRHCRQSFAFFTVRWLFKKRTRWSPALVTMTRNDASFWRWYPAEVVKVALLLLTKRFTPPM